MRVLYAGGAAPKTIPYDLVSRSLGLILDLNVNRSKIRADLCGSEYSVKLRMAPSAAPTSIVVTGVVLIVFVRVVRIR